MIYWICRISERSVRAKTENISEVTTMEADQDLVAFIEGGLAPGSSYIRDILKYQVIANNNNEHFSVVENIEILNQCSKPYVYTSDIAVAFHHLLVSSLLSYVFRLRIVDKAVRSLPVEPDSDLPTAVVEAFIQLLISARLLFWLSHSRLFKKHLMVLRDFLMTPAEEHVPVYRQEFETFALRHPTCHDDDRELMSRIAASASGDNPSQPHPEAVQASAVKDSESVVQASEEESDAAATDEVLDRFSSSDLEMEVVYRRWIMGLADHFASIRVLERVSGKLPREAEINFSILGLNRQSLQPSSWATMVEEIRTLCKDSSLISMASEQALPDNFADKAIEIIETKIKGYDLSGSSTSMKKTPTQFEAAVYSSFKKKLSQSQVKKCPGCEHCETLLMSIIHRICKKNDLDFSLKACPP